MDKNRSLEGEKFKVTQFMGSLVLGAGALVIMSLSILDYFVAPEHFSKFLIYRSVTSFFEILLLILLILNKQKKSRYIQAGIFTLGTLAVSIMVELMILHFGGHQSTYYAGMIIVFMFTIGFLPLFSFKISLFLAVSAFAIYLFPILVLDNITNAGTFINNTAFLIATASIGLLWRYYNDRILTEKLSLEYDLSQEKERLQQYSTHLEDIVAQRTKELAISEQKYRGLFDNASDGVAVYDSSGIIINVNRKFCEQHGFPADTLIGSNLRVFDATKDDREEEERIKRIADGESLIYETRHVRRDGETILFEISAKALNIDGQIYIQAFHRDISDKKRLQEQLFQSQKMDSIGMLAGGLAHDFNNVICAIIGHIELLGEHENLDADARNRLAIIESSSRRASKMISKLLRFARKGAIDIQPVELNAVVRDTYELISKTLSGKQAEVSLELNETIPEIMGDANQIEQVIMNLMVNAGDAMPSGGRITVKTDASEIGREATQIHPLLAPGPYVILTVSDTGTGISDDIRNKIFDPFFTTKEHGKGTGLGLAMVYGIVKDHKGVITVETQSGKGTTFNVYLPASHVGLPSRSLICDFGEMAKGTVLVIDDHKEMLSFVSETVESLGYIVKSANNAIFALQLFKESAAEIGLVITDIFMPLIDGRDVVKNIKSIKPSTKVIAMSGYQIEEFVQQDSPVDIFLRKPFGKIELIAAIYKLMQPSRSIHSS
jgi:two-component system, cell cycle sensor histidine kinase and response regulator CckA